MFPIKIFVIFALCLACSCQSYIQKTEDFDGNRAYEDVIYQVSLGPRTPNSNAHRELVQWLQDELEDHGWEVEMQVANQNGHEIRNVIARLGKGSPWIIIGAHYDSRLIADRDPVPDNRNLPVPGANDGASGVAVLTELARILPAHLSLYKDHSNIDAQIWLVFFDAEDNGNIPGWDWILGSEAFVERLEGKPDAVVIVDMIGDLDLNIYKEKNSDPELSQQIWDQAAELGYNAKFIDDEKYRILDDHIPFLEAGIPAVDIIDFDYQYWHTISDTTDKVSAESLEIVGSTLIKWLTKTIEDKKY